MKSTLYAGCSLTAGFGFDKLKHDPSLWVNILHQEHPKLQLTELINVGITGASNYTIFKTVFDHICIRDDLAFVIVQWTSVPRYNLNLAIETYDTSKIFIPNLSHQTITHHERTYTGSYLKKIQNNFLSLLNDHYEILDLLRYVNWINTICKWKGIKVFHINGLCPWDPNYFTKLHDVTPDRYTPYTKSLLNTETREDTEIFILYERVHQDYASVGGIQPHTWLNLYESLRSQQIDTNNDNIHPGSKSNQIFSKLLASTLDNL